MLEAIGVDVGGTKVAVGRVRVGDGAVLDRRQFATGKADSDRVLADALSLAAEMMSPEVGAIGVGLCELVDHDGIVRSAQTVDWLGLDLAASFGTIARTLIQSDVRAAARAEARYGTAKDCGHVLYVSVGTGVSCTLLIDGMPYSGADGFGLVLGERMLEGLVSGAGLQELLGIRSLVAETARSHVRVVVAAAAESLGKAVAVLVNALGPRLIVVGGGLGLSDLYFTHLELGVRRHVDSTIGGRLEIVRAALGADAGLIGAAACAAERWVA